MKPKFPLLYLGTMDNHMVLKRYEGLSLLEHILDTPIGSGDSVNVTAAKELMKELGVDSHEHQTTRVSGL